MQRLRALIEPRFASRDSPAAPDDGPRWAKGLRKPRPGPEELTSAVQAPRHLGGGGGGSAPTPGAEFDRYGGHTSCLAIAHDGERPSLIIDAGTGIRRASDLLGNGPGLFNAKPYTGAIVLGHMHWDHLGARAQGDIESVLERYMISPLPDRTGGPGGLVELHAHDPGRPTSRALRSWRSRSGTKEDEPSATGSPTGKRRPAMPFAGAKSECYC